MSKFETEAMKEIELLTGWPLFHTYTAIKRVTSERSRDAVCLNDDISCQIVLEDRVRQLFIADPQTLDPDLREVVPQLVVIRDISRDLQTELGWSIAMVDDFPYGSMTEDEQYMYYQKVVNVAEPLDARAIDGKIIELAPKLTSN